MLLEKGVYSFEYKDSWERFNESTFPYKKALYSRLYIKDITDEDYIHALQIKIFEGLELKNIGEYHDLYVQSDTLFFADVFENFRNKCIEIYKIDPAHLLNVPGLAWQAFLKKTG